VLDIDGINSFDRAEIARKYFQNAQIILTTAYSAKDLSKIVQVGAVIVDETGLVGLDTMAMLFSSLRHDNGKVLVIGDVDTGLVMLARLVIVNQSKSIDDKCSLASIIISFITSSAL
jgi:hypothetical protein